ncbi:glycine cleavage system protein GcvH [Gracilibacillus sp. S3-1-1]|uniref:Glycine cleavage system protein GcvH n=1 Tax=Gracilibacillus pellucidus TaxID=3095368 RepID=A0ACC6M0D5_9BACI|nr:glycine cleavage system protein GcvH [Gracilibacillus sp. S3-1-1]MDX8044357.1 glycine cleavage system protein GcvH [Gracilibacillus sp. S3-1-1]
MTSSLRYSKEHEWVLPLEGNKAHVGITNHAQQELGDIVFVEHTEVGTKVNANDSLGVSESVKAASEVYSPLSGTIITINETLEEQPELINEDPYVTGWIAEIEFSNIEALENLLDETAYLDFISKGEE